MKLVIEVELHRDEGERVEPEEVAKDLCQDVSMSNISIHGSDNDAYSEYSVISARLIDVTRRR